MDVLGILALFFAVAIFGAWTANMGYDRDCKIGNPIVIENKVYKCVEQK